MKDKAAEIFKKYRYPLLVLLLGLLLILLPSKSSERQSDAELYTEQELKLQRVLESCAGVGEAYVLISEEGVVIACEGASHAEVKYAVLKAAEAFTGFTGDRIEILRTEQISGGSK